MEHTYEVEEIETKSGYSVLKVNGYLLHSKYNPITEAKKIAEEHYTMHFIHILFGYGKGYIVDQLFEKLAHNESIIIIDPLVEEGITIIHKRHHKERIYYWGPSTLNSLAYYVNSLTTARETEIKFICSSNYDKIFPNELKKVLQMVKDLQEKSMVNKNTVLFFAEKWQKNLSENLYSIVNDQSLEKLHSKYSKPVIIASGGPSLTKQLPLLKQVRENVIVIAAGSTINSLLAADIEPDFVISIDGGEPNYEHFKDLRLKNASLIYSVFNHPQIRDSFEKESFTFVASGQEVLIKYFNKKFDIILPKMTGGGTVAQYSLSVGQYISTGPIAMIGQDLAFTNNQTHAASNKHEKEITEKDKGNIIEADGYYDDKVLTSKVLYSMKFTFEEMAKYYPPKVPVYNCTEGGLKINGYKQISFKEFCEKYINSEATEEIILKQSIPNKQNTQRIINVLEEELKIYKKLTRILEEAMSILEKNRLKISFTNVLNKLEKLDQKLSNLYPEVQMDFIVTPIVLEIRQAYLEKENETEIEKFNRIYKQSEVLYSKLLLATRNAMSITLVTKEKLEIKENYE